MLVLVYIEKVQFELFTVSMYTLNTTLKIGVVPLFIYQRAGCWSPDGECTHQCVTWPGQEETGGTERSWGTSRLS